MCFFYKNLFRWSQKSKVSLNTKLKRKFSLRKRRITGFGFNLIKFVPRGQLYVFLLVIENTLNNLEILVSILDFVHWISITGIDFRIKF